MTLSVPKDEPVEKDRKTRVTGKALKVTLFRLVLMTVSILNSCRFGIDTVDTDGSLLDREKGKGRMLYRIGTPLMKCSPLLRTVSTLSC